MTVHVLVRVCGTRWPKAQPTPARPDPLPVGMLPVNFLTGSGSLQSNAGPAFSSFAVLTAVQSVKAVAAVWKRRLTESVFTGATLLPARPELYEASKGLPKPSLMMEPTLEAGASAARVGARSGSLDAPGAEGCEVGSALVSGSAGVERGPGAVGVLIVSQDLCYNVTQLGCVEVPVVGGWGAGAVGVLIGSHDVC